MHHRRTDDPDEPRRRAAEYAARTDDADASALEPEAADSPGTDAESTEPPLRPADDPARYADLAVRDAMRRGEFDNLAYAGKPLPNLDAADPDWWLKGLIEREHLTGLGPPAIMLRVEDARLDATLDGETAERVVRETVEDFNKRVIEARRQLQGGPPVVTPTRDVELEVDRWRRRREDRSRAAEQPRENPANVQAPARRRWWRRPRPR